MNQKTVIVQAAEPAVMYEGMLWFDIDDDKLKQRNAADNAWIERPGVTLAATISGLWTFDRGAAVPFAVGAGSLVIPNLDAHLLDGQHRVLKINADHDHEGAGAEGGTLDVAAIAAGILAVARGGTGLGAYAQGGILYISAANTLSRLAPAAANRVLRSTGANALEFGVLVVGDIPTLTTGKLSDVPAAAWATIFSNAFAIATVLTDHDKAAHDALDIDSDTLDTFHATSFPRLRDTEKNLELDGVGETEICAYTIDGTDRIMRVATFFRVITGATVVTVTVKYITFSHKP